jgi:methyl-accepting chemotaxis protein
VDGISESNKLVNSIVGAANEQKLAIRQMNENIVQISDIVQHNADRSKESTATSKELSGKSETLGSLLEQFEKEVANA